ncbi:protein DETOXIFICATION 12-like isoform X2 [Salvia miltiorrhiza]|uniref:protein DETOXIFICATION 12-like isoform X2 n=1 Tax=Salvia miltiorrhiza TaxID=226208 RepID=UPI0025AC004E|nr:protein DETOXIFICATION 12-like isoform X2 [Salvia miltiorrhiza]XP_057809611.1 protein DETOXIFICATION 12-like isoform X2 [Salvia miltiorrhiza]
MRGEGKKWEDLMQQVKKVGYIAGPMVLVSMLQYLLQVVSTMMVGHLGRLTLSSVAIATSLTNVTGFSLLSGLVGGLETLCGQAYGAGQYQKLGVYTYSAVFSLAAVCIPVSLAWVLMEKLLVAMGQDPLVSLQARDYSLRLIPALFAAAVSKPLVRYLQTQSLVLPMVVSSFVVLCCHIPTTWALVYKLDMGSSGAATAVCISNWLYVFVLAVYIRYSPSCKATRLAFSVEAFRHIGEFFRFAAPSAVMVCLKWWSLEVLVLVSGLLPNPTLETSVLSICLTISTLHLTIPYGLGAAASTRVSNELGAGNADKARLVVWVAMFLAVAETVAVSILLLCLRHVLGRAYSNERQVVNYIAGMTPLICVSTITDSLQVVISGIARGSGWQHIGAYVNLGAFYVVGVPAAVALGFAVHLNARGLWIGILIGSVLQSTVMSVITGFTNWNKQATEAQERVAEAPSSHP